MKKKERALSIVERLKSYSAAAGLGAFAFVPTSQGEIVFTDVSDQTITQGRRSHLPEFG